jgi:GDP-L-fucose synthase
MKIFVAGHKGLVGQALVRRLKDKNQLLLVEHSQLELTDEAAVNYFFKMNRPEQVYLAAAKVGGILDHVAEPVDYIQDNLRIQMNVIGAAHDYGVKKLLFLGSACAYPKLAATPIAETALGCGELEPTNKGYALAKIIGHELCQAYWNEASCNFISAIPTNLYGIGDTYDERRSHVLPAMIRKFHLAKKNGDKSVTLWGNGLPTREFLWADDLADACVYLMDHYDQPAPVNVGSGRETPLWFLAALIKEVVGYDGEIQWDTTKPTGTPRRLLDSRKIFGLGWKPSTTLEEGVRRAYDDYRCRFGV